MLVLVEMKFFCNSPVSASIVATLVNPARSVSWRNIKVDTPSVGWSMFSAIATNVTISCSDIGEKAGVKVSDTKYASAHDLRRAFGERWKHKLMSHELRDLMRHKSSATTEQFYLDSNSENLSQKLTTAGCAFAHDFSDTNENRLSKNAKNH